MKQPLYLSHAFLLACLGMLFLALFSAGLTGFWRGDDTAILNHLLENPLWSIFTDPQAWQRLSPSNLTPWVSLSFLLDYQVAGLTPAFFYLHHLMSLFLAALAGYLLLSRYIDRHWALLGACLFLTGAPAMMVSVQLMTRHYIEGLTLSLFSLYFLSHYQRRRQLGFLLLSAAAYLLAVTAKEIYVPLLILVLLLAQGPFKQRLRTCLPFVLIALGYVLWRRYMLADLVGGYTDSSAYFDPGFWAAALQELAAIPQLLLGSHWRPLALLYGIILTAGLLRDRRHVLLFLVSGLLIVVPLVPLTGFPGLSSPNRYMLLPWFGLTYAFTFAAYRIQQRIAAPARQATLRVLSLLMWAAVITLGAGYGIELKQTAQQSLQQNDVQMRFIWEQGEEVAIVPHLDLTGSYWKVRSLVEIKQRLRPQSSVPAIIIDDRFLTPGGSVYQYSAACGCMQDISGQVPQRLRELDERWHEDAPLSLQVRNEQGLVFWQFGPYIDGEYRIISEQFGSYRMSNAGSALRTRIDYEVRFYLLYLSPEGWRTYSPLITLASNGTAVNWRRQ